MNCSVFIQPVNFLNLNTVLLQLVLNIIQCNKITSHHWVCSPIRVYVKLNWRQDSHLWVCPPPVLLSGGITLNCRLQMTQTAMSLSRCTLTCRISSYRWQNRFPHVGQTTASPSPCSTRCLFNEYGWAKVFGQSVQAYGFTARAAGWTELAWAERERAELKSSSHVWQRCLELCCGTASATIGRSNALTARQSWGL